MVKIISIQVVVMLMLASIVMGQDIRFQEILDKANAGDTKAMCQVGLAYYHGRQTLKDPFKANCWIKKAHDNGSRKAEKIWNDLELWRYSGNCGPAFENEVSTGFRDGEEFQEPNTGIWFKYISPGCFRMGCQFNDQDCRKNEHPVHRVCLDGFWIGIYEVTQGQWQQIMGSNPSRFKRNLQRPVENVSFQDIEIFLTKVNQMISGTCMLPSEAQWEFACRKNNKKSRFPWPEEHANNAANCGSCTPVNFQGETIVIGSFPPNAAGLFDMGGNVKEWCRDYYDKKAYQVHEKKQSSVYR